MSNKPKIYGTCPAGCLFETIHRDEFDASATYKRLRLEDGAINVEMLRKYKIVPATDEDSGEYAMSITAVLSNGEEYDISPEDGFNYDPYHTYIFFECLDLQPSYLGYYNLIFEVDGQRYTTEIDSPDHSVDATIDHIVITGAAEVSLYSDGQIEATDGKSAFIRYSAYEDGTDFTEEFTAGQRYIGVAVAHEAPAAKEAYEWSKFVGDGVPPVTPTDNGKFLRVVDGAWAAVALTDVSQEGA